MNCEDSWVFLSTSPPVGVLQSRKPFIPSWSMVAPGCLIASTRRVGEPLMGMWVSYGFMMFSFCTPVLGGVV